MSNPDTRICFFGDSFTAGVGDPEALGWVGRVTAAALADGYNLTSYNLGVRRETSSDILQRWKRECEARVMPGTEMRLVFSFGANDTALDQGQRRLTLDQTLANARVLLHEASALFPVLLIGPPPVADAAHDLRIGELTLALATVAQQESVPFLDVFSPLQTSTVWRAEVTGNDGSHPRSGGYRQWAALVDDWSAWWFEPMST